MDLSTLYIRFYPLFQPWLNLWKRFPLLDRYVWSTLCPPYLFALGLFSGLTISFGALFDILNDLVETPIPLSILAQLFALQLPYCIGLAMPMAVLLATLISWGKLAADSEITAFKSFGVSVYRLLLPVLAFGLLISSIAFTINETVVPICRQQADALVEEVTAAGLGTNQVQNIFFPQYDNKGNINRLFFANRLEGSQLFGLTLLDFSQQGVEQIITAATAAWNQATNTWSLEDGTVYFVDSSVPAATGPSADNPPGETDDSGQSFSGNVMQFGQQELQLPRKEPDTPPEKDFAAMTLTEAQAALQRLEASPNQRRARRLAIQIQQRFAIPFQGVVLAMMGTALTMGSRRSGNSSSRGFGWSFLVLIGQYLSLFIATGMGINGVLPTWLAAWLPAFLGLGLAVYWLRRR
jgi:lipopolysaccharide export system permease protein